MQDGWATSVEVPRGTRQLSAVGTEGAGAVIRWSLAVGDATPFPKIDGLVVAGKGGDQDAAKQLRELTRSADPAMRGPAEAGLARVMLAQGNMDEAEAAFHRALEAYRKERRLSNEMREGSALSWGLVAVRQRFADARAVLASLAGARDGYPEGQAWYAQNEGLLAAETGDLRGALARYRRGPLTHARELASSAESVSDRHKFSLVTVQLASVHSVHELP
jgi:tetratricopeptide (TPR) repeat protein